MRLHRFIILFLCAAAMVLPWNAHAQSGEQIISFQAIATLTQDRTLRVTENISYDFTVQEKHGIYREIPTRYERNNGAYKLRLNVEGVTMDGEPVPYTIESRSPAFRIRIGDSDKTVTGLHRYEITYATDRAINFFDKEAELYWNVTGDAWQVPISNASFSIVGPEGFNANSEQAVCFTGPYGSREQKCQVFTQANTAQFYASRTLNPGEGLTVAIRFPEGVIAAPTIGQRIWQVLADNWILGLPIIVFIAMFYLWRTRGKEPKGCGTIVPQYDPPRGLAPIEMAALKNQSLGHAAITATILDLARRGYMKIDFKDEKGFLGGMKQKYGFTKRKEADDSLEPFERILLTGMFDGERSVDLEDLKGRFYKDIVKIKEQTFASIKKKNLFGGNPNAVRAMYIIAAVVLGALLFWLIPVFGFGALGAASIIVSSLIVIAFGWQMPKKTGEGAVALEEVEGFKWFLSVTEKDRLKFHNAPEAKPETFHAFLPYAIAFGVEAAWAKQFEGIDVPPPDYATGITSWNAVYFANSLHTLDAHAATAAYSAPSSAGSGGSGFSGGGSGGGFGGGGGGSW